MKNITPISNRTPAFGMAVKFDKAGRKFFNDVFKENPKAGEEYILRQAQNKSSDIFVNGSRISVGIDGKKWGIVGYMTNENHEGKLLEEILLLHKKNPFRGFELKTLVREGQEPFSKTYGTEGKLLAVAEDIANYQSYKTKNKAPSILQNIKALLFNK